MSFTFVRWARYGVAAALDPAVVEPGGGPRARLTVGVEATATGLPSAFSSLAIDVLGPGDVQGIDQRQVVRTFPVAGTNDFEASYLAHLELDRPDLPWLFTPAAPDASGKLRPWICLAVIAKRQGVKLEPGTPLPRLTIADGAGAALPPLADAHLWSHVQVSGDAASAAATLASPTSERTISRLICPTALQPDTAYLACLVPTFKVGVDAGLGNEVPATATLDDAWAPNAVSVELPVYFHWEFATGRSGDFKSLVARLQSRAAIAGVGTRPLDVTTPGFGVRDRAAPTSIDLGGALRVADPAPPPIDEGLARDLATQLAQDGLTAPIYGHWHAGVAAIVHALAPAWLEALNLDVRYRVAAGLGTQVVQERQEDLMAAIWEQLGEILRANQLLRNAQLAIAASERVVARHLAPLRDLELLSVAGPAFGRIRASNQGTVRSAVAESCAPLGAFSGAFRRLVRIRGPLGRRFTRLVRPGISDLLAEPGLDPGSVLASLAAGTWNAPRPSLPDGAIAAPSSLTRAPRVRVVRPGPLDVRPAPPVVPPPLGELAAPLQRLALADRAPACTALAFGDLAARVRDAVTPDVAIPPRVRAQLSLPRSARIYLSDRLDPVMAAPEILTPMIGPLQERGQDWLLPGLERLPPNTITIVEPDAAFIEAYMVGLNHEIGREMLWRGFPTDQRGTVFARFWDRRGAVASTAAPIPARDLPDIATWKASSALGSHLDPGTGAGVVLLVRGDLLARYPRPTIFLQRARWKRVVPGGDIVVKGNLAEREPVPLASASDWEANVHFPSMQGRTGPDILFLGFPRTRLEVRGLGRVGLSPRASDDDAGFYVVFQEQPTEPRFGYPTAAATVPPTATTPEDLAAALLRKAFRMFVHGSDLVSA